MRSESITCPLSNDGDDPRRNHMNRKNEHVRLALSSLFLCISVLGCGAEGSDALDERGSSSAALSSNSQGGNGKGSVSDRLGGFPGILSFLEDQVVPAELADPE